MENQGTRTTDGSVFGHEFAVPDEDAPSSDWLDGAPDITAAASVSEDEDGAQPTPQVEGSQEDQPQEQAPAPVATTPAQGEQQPAPQPDGSQAAPEEGTRKWAKRFETPEAMEAAYEQLRKSFDRELQARRRLETRVAAAPQPTPQLPPQQPRPLQAVPDQSQVAEELLTDPQRLQQYIDQQVAARLDQATSQMEQSQRDSELMAVAQDFMAAHPDVLPNSEIDIAINDVFHEFQSDPDGNVVEEYFPPTRENLEVAHELATNPQLRQVVQELDIVPANASMMQVAREVMADPALRQTLIANPTALDTDEGIQWARNMSRLPGLYSQAAAGAQPPTAEQQRTAAFVETGGTGAPIQSAPGAVPKPKDTFDEALDSWETQGTDNVFGLAAN